VRDAVTGSVRLNAAVFPGYGKRLNQPGFFPGGFRSSPDEQRMVGWTRDGWALIDPVHSRIVMKRSGSVTPDAGSHVAFRPDGKRLLTIDVENTVLWDTNSGEMLLHLPYAITPSRFSPDGKQIAWAVDNRVSLYSTDTGKLEHSLDHPGMVSPSWPGLCVWFSSDGRLLLTNSTDGMARLWDPATGERVGPPIPMPGADGVSWFVGSDRILFGACPDAGKGGDSSSGASAGPASARPFEADRRTVCVPQRFLQPSGRRRNRTRLATATGPADKAPLRMGRETTSSP